VESHHDGVKRLITHAGALVAQGAASGRVERQKAPWCGADKRWRRDQILGCDTGRLYHDVARATPEKDWTYGKARQAY